jgi:hypothetical protein
MFNALETSRTGLLEYDQLPALFRQIERRLREEDVRALATLVHLYDCRSEGKVGRQQGCQLGRRWAFSGPKHTSMPWSMLLQTGSC